MTPDLTDADRSAIMARAASEAPARQRLTAVLYAAITDLRESDRDWREVAAGLANELNCMQQKGK